MYIRLRGRFVQRTSICHHVARWPSNQLAVYWVAVVQSVSHKGTNWHTKHYTYMQGLHVLIYFIIVPPTACMTLSYHCTRKFKMTVIVCDTRLWTLAALRRHVRHGSLPSDALHTADFVETCNDLFDTFNCFGHMPSVKKPINAANMIEVLSVSSSLFKDETYESLALLIESSTDSFRLYDLTTLPLFRELMIPTLFETEIHID